MLTRTLIVISLMLLVQVAHAQQPQPSPSPTPPNEDQEPVKVFTEEVRLPVIALDQYGHYDPTLELDDILVLENGVAQQIRSVRRIPPNVLLVLDTGNEQTGLGGMSKRTSLTRDVAMQLVNQLQDGTWISVMQFSNSVETLQPWTLDKKSALKVLKTKLLAGKRSRFSEAVVAAAQLLKDRPEGTRHVVFITDGVDTPGGKIARGDAIKRLNEMRATVHIISYTEYVRQEKRDSPSNVTFGQSSAPTGPPDPTLPPGTTRSPSYGVSIRFDPQMKRVRKAYENEVKKSQQTLTTVAEETGGRIFLPINEEEMLEETKEVAADIGAEYVVTYRPKRALASSPKGEYRRIEVASRRVGLTLRSRRGYVVPTQ